MLAKWIVAEASNRAAFDEAQRRWAELLKHDGFIVQMGGWLESFSSKAGIFAAWRDFGAYRRFMESGHDELANQQRESYERIETSVASQYLKGVSQGVSQEWREVKGGLGLSAVAAAVLRKNH